MGHIKGTHIFSYFYSIATITSLIIYCFRVKLFRSNIPVKFTTILLNVTFSVFCIILVLQTINQIKHFAYEQKKYASKSIAEKLPKPLNAYFNSGAYFREILPGKHSTEFISDLDLSKDPGMFLFRAVAYYFYPIDTRNIRQEPKDTAIIIEKTNPLQSIPDGFEIVGSYRQQYYYLKESRGYE